MYPYHVSQVCTSGHLITDSYDLFECERKKFCPKCGAKTITKCQSCGAEILGVVDGVHAEAAVEAYCYNCGKPYPWTESALHNAALIIQEESKLSDELKASMVSSLPDITAETPGTNLAIVRMKKVLSTVGDFSVDALRQFVIDFGCEMAKKLLFP